MKTKNNTTISTRLDEQNNMAVLNCCESLDLNSEQIKAVKSDISLFYNVDCLEECILSFLTGMELI